MAHKVWAPHSVIPDRYTARAHLTHDNRLTMNLKPLSVLTIIVTQALASTQAQDAVPSRWTLQLSPYSYHFNPSEEHRHVYMVGAERERADGRLDGAVYFRNSFGQPSLYLYPWGHHYAGIFGQPKLSFKWTAGLLYGYKEPYEKKVPLNYKGFSPGAIIALAYQFDSGWSAQVDALGTAGLMFQLNIPIR
ncbi:MAG: hypothetical protein Fur007_10100 [Rhodoferax sp.]